MRVALIVRPSAGLRGGGDVTQARFTERGLARAGVDAQICSGLEPDLHGFDLAHIFGAFDPEICEVQLTHCRRAGLPVALSPIWWDLYEFFGQSRAVERMMGQSPGRIERGLERLRATPAARLHSRKETRRYATRIASQQRLMREADVLLPNSTLEAHFYLTKLNLYDRPIVVVHNPVDVPQDLAPAERSGVACVARIEQKKNQAMLLYALRDVDCEVLLIGGSHEPSYLELCRRWMTSRTQLIGNLEHSQVLERLRRVAVHVLPSWAETPGIANLEAAAAGARTIVSNDGTEVEYFGNLATYVDPLDPEAIRAAVLAALAAPPRTAGDELAQRLTGYSAEMVGRRTLEGYRIALATRLGSTSGRA